MFGNIRTKDGKPLFSERDILDYIEEQCGWDVKNFVETTINEVDGLQEEIRDLEDRVDNYY